MIVEYQGNRPEIDPTACVAPTAVVRGEVRIGAGTAVLYGAVLARIAPGGSPSRGSRAASGHPGSDRGSASEPRHSDEAAVGAQVHDPGNVVRWMELGEVVVASLLLSTPSASAQGSRCRPSDYGSAAFLAYGVDLATSDDPEVVSSCDRYGILAVPESEVQLVTHDGTSKTAAREYKETLGFSGPAPAVQVFRIVSRFIVMDPNARVGEVTPHVVLDEEFNVLAKFIG